jgi:hypothetical protein
MITPTIGRVVLFHRDSTTHMSDQPYPALVSYVWNDKLINVGYFDASGVPGNATSVVLIQDDELPPSIGHWAEWMPYQKAVAAKG